MDPLLCACASGRAFVAVAKGDPEVVRRLQKMATTCADAQMVVAVQEVADRVRTWDVDSALNYDVVRLDHLTARYTPMCIRYNTFRQATGSRWLAMIHTLTGGGAMRAKSLGQKKNK